jgi:hypothetical protein
LGMVRETRWPYPARRVIGTLASYNTEVEEHCSTPTRRKGSYLR